MRASGSWIKVLQRLPVRIDLDARQHRGEPMDATSWEDELPVAQLPADPTWRENFCFDGYDRERNVGFWIHCGRWSLDRKSTRLNSSHGMSSRMPSSA